MINWYPIDSVPDDMQFVLFYVPGKLPTIEHSINWRLNRPDSCGSGTAHWLDGATHWSPLILPDGSTP
jgi:hypothetical protein